MSSLEERVALLEGRVQDQAAFISIVHSTGAEVRQSIHDLSNELRPQIASLRTETAALRTETGALRTDVGGLRYEMERRLGEMNRRLDRADRRFGWLVGIVVTGFVVTIGAITGALWTVLQFPR
jgi:hypothetical protein